MSPEPVFKVIDLSFQRGSRFQLDISALLVSGDRSLALIGPTGSGKSTLLHLLAGILMPTSGQICFAGQDWPGRSRPLAWRRRVTLVHQRPVLLSGTVHRNVSYGLRLRKRSDYARQTDIVLGQLGLTACATQSARTLSGGQTQLVALARALACAPEVLILDEPTAHLDPANVARVEQVVQDYRESSGAAVIWATHNMFQARRVADDTALLLDGRLIELAPSDAFFSRPRDPRTAAFVQGEMIY